MTLTVSEIKQLAELAGFIIKEFPANTVFDEDEKQTEISIEPCPDIGVRDDDGSVIHCKYIAYFDEYPEEGVYPIGTK